jgi:hypothetical protein
MDVSNALSHAARNGKVLLDYRADRLDKAKQKQLFMATKEQCFHGNQMILVKNTYLGINWNI